MSDLCWNSLNCFLVFLCFRHMVLGKELHLFVPGRNIYVIRQRGPILEISNLFVCLFLCLFVTWNCEMVRGGGIAEIPVAEAHEHRFASPKHLSFKIYLFQLCFQCNYWNQSKLGPLHISPLSRLVASPGSFDLLPSQPQIIAWLLSLRGEKTLLGIYAIANT